MIHYSGPTWLASATFALAFLTTGFLLAYPVGNPFNLEQLNAHADIIVKVVALESEPLENEWFEKIQGFDQSDSNDDWKSTAGSNVPEGIYKLYVSKGLIKRAKEFRKLCKKRLAFDAEVYFKRIDTANR